MFTGLIQHVGTLHSISTSSDGGRLAIDIGPLAAENSLGASIAVNGCCLTIVTLSGTVASFDAVPETLRRTSLGSLTAGSHVNLESALRPDSRMGGHFVQGHIDTMESIEVTENILREFADMCGNARARIFIANCTAEIKTAAL